VILLHVLYDLDLMLHCMSLSRGRLCMLAAVAQRPILVTWRKSMRSGCRDVAGADIVLLPQFKVVRSTRCGSDGELIPNRRECLVELG
jgi:hypothetical protein